MECIMLNGCKKLITNVKVVIKSLNSTCHFQDYLFLNCIRDISTSICFKTI